MNTEKHNSRIKALAYEIWEEQGRPEGRHEENWAEAERRLRFEAETDRPRKSDDPVTSSRIPEARKRGGETQDTPGRANPTSSRQQTHHEQTTQTGSAEIDSKAAGSSRRTRPR